MVSRKVYARPVVDLSRAIEVVLEHAGDPRRAARVAALKAQFEERTGAYTPDDAWFEVRSSAFWDDALTRGRFGDEVASLLDEGVRFWLKPLAAAHRGLFRVAGGATREGHRLDDVWSGASFRVAPSRASGLADALRRAEGFVDGRVVAAVQSGTLVVELLGGAVFHPADATPSIESLVPIARERRLSRDALLDPLLRMELAFRNHSRVKASFAYRKEALKP